MSADLGTEKRNVKFASDVATTRNEEV